MICCPASHYCTSIFSSKALSQSLEAQLSSSHQTFAPATLPLIPLCIVLQANVNKGSITLADNGALLANRLAQLQGNIARQSELVQMYAEQSYPNIEASMSHNVAVKPLGDDSAWLETDGQRQDQSTSRPAHTQHTERQQNQSGSADALGSQHTRHSAKPQQESRHAVQSNTTPTGNRRAAVDRHIRSTADRRHQHDQQDRSNNRRDTHASEASKLKQNHQVSDARKSRREFAPSSRYPRTCLLLQLQNWMQRNNKHVC